MRFMSNQKRAHDFNRHIILSAEARETAVLVRRYLRILLETQIRVGQIVAITFTEKAVTTLKHRIVRKVDNLLVQGINQQKRCRFQCCQRRLQKRSI